MDEKKYWMISFFYFKDIFPSHSLSDIIFCVEKTMLTLLSKLTTQSLFLMVNSLFLISYFFSFSLLQASSLPMSIIIVGIGDADFDGEFDDLVIADRNGDCLQKL